MTLHADTIESLSVELGTVAGRKDDANEAGVSNVAFWLVDAITADVVTIERDVKPVVRIMRKNTTSLWTWPGNWPHDRLQRFIEREREARGAV